MSDERMVMWNKKDRNSLIVKLLGILEETTLVSWNVKESYIRKLIREFSLEDERSLVAKLVRKEYEFRVV